MSDQVEDRNGAGGLCEAPQPTAPDSLSGPEGLLGPFPSGCWNEGEERGEGPSVGQDQKPESGPFGKGPMCRGPNKKTLTQSWKPAQWLLKFS